MAQLALAAWALRDRPEQQAFRARLALAAQQGLLEPLGQAERRDRLDRQELRTLALLACKARPVLMVLVVLLVLRVPPEFKGLREPKGLAVPLAQPEQLVSLARPVPQECLALLGLQDRLALVLVARLVRQALPVLLARRGLRAQLVLPVPPVHSGQPEQPELLEPQAQLVPVIWRVPIRLLRLALAPRLSQRNRVLRTWRENTSA